MALIGFHRLIAPTANPEGRTVNRRNALIMIGTVVVAVSIPLTATSVTLAHDTFREARTPAAARKFGEEVGRKTGNATTRKGVVTVHREEPPPLPKMDRLRNELKKRGVDPTDVRVELVPARVVTFD